MNNNIKLYMDTDIYSLFNAFLNTDEDINGNNGQMYKWAEAKQFESTKDYLLYLIESMQKNKVSEDHILTNIMERILTNEDYYISYDYSILNNTIALVVEND